MKSFFKYFSQSPEHKEWGVNLISCGYHQISPGDIYSPLGHPDSHIIRWSEGRRLKGFYLVYIPTGAGILETHDKFFEVNPGDMLMLYDNDWHRYKPNFDEGWEEYWIGFQGDFFDKAMRREVFPDNRSYIKRLGYNQEIIFLMGQALELIKRNTKGYRKILVGILIQLLAHIITTEDYESAIEEESIAQRAQLKIRKQLYKSIDFKALASDFNLSYSRFRVIFKQHTGISPQQYLIRERIQNAHRLLLNTDKGIKEVALLAGFQSEYYFSRMFKKKTGLSPTEARMKTF